MMRKLFWKEWREHHWKYAAYWLTLNLPMLLVVLAVALSTGARVPFADLSNATASKYLGIALMAESAAVATVFLLATGFLAVSTFRPELDDGSVFYLFEQPVKRERYLAMKLSIGAFYTMAAAAFAVVFAPAAAYAAMLIGGRVTFAGSSAAFAMVMAGAGRAAVWCALISLAVFTGCALLSALMPRWWMAAASSVLLVIALIAAGADFFDFVGPTMNGFEGSIGIGFGSSQWLTTTGSLPVNGFAAWRALPLMTALAITGVFAVGLGFVYRRKEMK